MPFGGMWNNTIPVYPIPADPIYGYNSTLCPCQLQSAGGCGCNRSGCPSPFPPPQGPMDGSWATFGLSPEVTVREVGGCRVPASDWRLKQLAPTEQPIFGDQQMPQDPMLRPRYLPAFAAEDPRNAGRTASGICNGGMCGDRLAIVGHDPRVKDAQRLASQLGRALIGRSMGNAEAIIRNAGFRSRRVDGPATPDVSWQRINWIPGADGRIAWAGSDVDFLNMLAARRRTTSGMDPSEAYARCMFQGKNCASGSVGCGCQSMPSEEVEGPRHPCQNGGVCQCGGSCKCMTAAGTVGGMFDRVGEPFDRWTFEQAANYMRTKYDCGTCRYERAGNTLRIIIPEGEDYARTIPGMIGPWKIERVFESMQNVAGPGFVADGGQRDIAESFGRRLIGLPVMEAVGRIRAAGFIPRDMSSNPVHTMELNFQRVNFIARNGRVVWVGSDLGNQRVTQEQWTTPRFSVPPPQHAATPVYQPTVPVLSYGYQPAVQVQPLMGRTFTTIVGG